MNNTTKSIIGAVLGLLVLVLGWGGMSYSSAQGAVQQAWLTMSEKVIEEGKMMTTLLDNLPQDAQISPDGKAKFSEGLRRLSSGKDQFDQAMGAGDMMKGVELVLADIEKNPSVLSAVAAQYEPLKKVSTEVQNLKKNYIDKAFAQQKSLNDFPSTIWANIFGAQAYPGI